jgi:hypothetical protein
LVHQREEWSDHFFPTSEYADQQTAPNPVEFLVHTSVQNCARAAIFFGAIVCSCHRIQQLVGAPI